MHKKWRLKWNLGLYSGYINVIKGSIGLRLAKSMDHTGRTIPIIVALANKGLKGLCKDYILFATFSRLNYGHSRCRMRQLAFRDSKRDPYLRKLRIPMDIRLVHELLCI